MAANKKDISEFEKMFDLSSIKDDDNDQAEEYGHSTGSSDTFDELAKEVSDKIEENYDQNGTITNVQISDHTLIEQEVVKSHKESPHDIIKDVCSEKAREVPVDNKIVIDDIFGEGSSIEQEENSSEDPINDSEEVCSYPVEESHSQKVSSPVNYGEIGGGDDKIEWILESPSDMFNSFYEKKRDLLFKYMVGGQVEYIRWTNELAEAQVVIRGEIFDHQLIINQMEEVQQHRERVKYIHVRVNNQYYTFKRFIDMMRGFMARIEYLKPVIRQEGLIMEHMRDLELYYARLESLHDSASKTERTLEKAFETLSRKCTICMELKPAERVEKTSSTSYVPPSPPSPPSRGYSKEFDEFDDLPTVAIAAPKDHKVGQIGWGEV